MFPPQSEKTLQEVLQGKRILWHPAYLDSDSELREFQIGMRECDPLIPDVYLLTDYRVEDAGLPRLGEVFTLNDNARLRSAKIVSLCEHRKLQGLQGALCFEEVFVRNRSNIGRVFECQLDCETKERGNRRVTAVYVVAESTEFLFNFLLPHRIAVDVIYQEHYHVGFNCCRTEGAWLQRAASVLQTKWYFSDEIGMRTHIDPKHLDEAYRIYPSLWGFVKADFTLPDCDLSTCSYAVEGRPCGAQCYKVIGTR